MTVCFYAKPCNSKGIVKIIRTDGVIKFTANEIGHLRGYTAFPMPGCKWTAEMIAYAGDAGRLVIEVSGVGNAWETHLPGYLALYFRSTSTNLGGQTVANRLGPSLTSCDSILRRRVY